MAHAQNQTRSRRQQHNHQNKDHRLRLCPETLPIGRRFTQTRSQSQTEGVDQGQTLAGGLAARDAAQQHREHQERQQRRQRAQRVQPVRAEFAQQDIRRLDPRQKQQAQRSLTPLRTDGVRRQKATCATQDEGRARQAAEDLPAHCAWSCERTRRDQLRQADQHPRQCHSQAQPPAPPAPRPDEQLALDEREQRHEMPSSLRLSARHAHKDLFQPDFILAQAD